jgi:DNA-binding response OmpR family regulator
MFNVDAFLVKPFEPEQLLSTINYVTSARILALSKDEVLLEKIGTIAKTSKNEVEICQNTQQLSEKMNSSKKYSLVIIHLAFIKDKPVELAPVISLIKKREINIIAYSDSQVEGLEENNMFAIYSAKREWEHAGIDLFFDTRITEQPLSAAIMKFVI